ncbi:hypothetical protein BN1013_01862 [Candidatus Rubidus massiliensis]|nr:MAG: hypothetical protein BGO10_01955 [Chlamydia sp. 32-24]CDZ81326.1 hypothetical protein BN1013_01862 [Candidatus Rubidus massiliensis]
MEKITEVQVIENLRKTSQEIYRFAFESTSSRGDFEGNRFSELEKSITDSRMMLVNYEEQSGKKLNVSREVCEDLAKNIQRAINRVNERLAAIRSSEKNTYGDSYIASINALQGFLNDLRNICPKPGG